MSQFTMSSFTFTLNWNATIFGMSVLELIAAAIGVVSVYLTVKQNPWCWPIGAVMVLLYVRIFSVAHLFADAGLQVVYFILQFYGWHQWLRGGRDETPLIVTRTPTTLIPLLAFIGIAGTGALGYSLNRWTSQHVAYLDSAITVFSLIAQWMMAKKLLENWLVWIAVDVVAVGVYAYKGLYPTAVLYTIFLGLAAAGYIAWRKPPLVKAVGPRPEGLEPVLEAR